MQLLRSFNSLERQTLEAVRITSSKDQVVLNSKSEFQQAPIKSVVATAGLQAFQGEKPGTLPGLSGIPPGEARG